MTDRPTHLRRHRPLRMTYHRGGAQRITPHGRGATHHGIEPHPYASENLHRRRCVPVQDRKGQFGKGSRALKSPVGGRWQAKT